MTSHGGGGSSTKAVEGPAGAFQGINDIERGDGLALRVLGVGNRITNDLKENTGPRHVEEQTQAMRQKRGPLADKGNELTFSKKILSTPRVSSYIKPEIRFTPPRRARRLIAGFVIPVRQRTGR